MISVAPLDVIALDLGGTSIKGGLFRGTTPVEVWSWPTHRERGVEFVVDNIVEIADSLRRMYPRVAAIGLVVPGIVNVEQGIGVYSENIGWRDIEFQSLIEKKTGLPVGFGHDVRAGGLAEFDLGVARGVQNFFFMPIGTGIAGAMYVEGKLLEDPYVGEIGHLNVGSGRECVCGGNGCLESVSTGPSLARSYKEATGTEISGGQELVALVNQGDLFARKIWQASTIAIAHALAAYVTLLAPELIVIGGGLSLAGSLLLDPVHRVLADSLPFQRKPELKSSQFGDRGPCYGAAILAQRRLARSFIDRAQIDIQSL